VRDYFLEPAQTNLELYAQVIARGSDQSQRRLLARAYHHALHQVFPLARGSGKPFITHLVGTASLVLQSGCPDEWVVAAILHAVYQRRVPYLGGLAPESRRPVITEALGPGVDDLIYRYTEFENQNLSVMTAAEVKDNSDVVTLRLADELEDLCGHALALHGGAPAEEPAVRGSFEWRRAAKVGEAESLIRTAQLLGLNGIERGISFWMDFSSVPDEMLDFRTGWFSSVDLAGTEDTGPVQNPGS